MMTEKSKSGRQISTAVEVGNMIRQERERQHISQGQFAKRIGIKQPSLSNIEKGETQQSKFLPAIEIGLGLEPGVLTSRFSRVPIGRTVDIHAEGLGLSGARDFPVYYMQPAMGEAGGYVLSAEAIEFVDRPPLLSAARDAFGICVYGDEMYPAYKPGDIVFVHPYRPPIIGADIVLRPSNVEDQRVVIAELRGETGTEWHLYQHRVAQVIKLKKAEWGRVDVIDGKYNRR